VEMVCFVKIQLTSIVFFGQNFLGKHLLFSLQLLSDYVFVN